MMSSDRLRRATAARLQRMPAEISRHPALLFAPAIEGYRDYAFGCVSGPSAGPRHIFHEMGHAAEFGPEAFRSRASEFGFKFKVRRIWIIDRFCDEPKTMQATERELRAFAHEFRLMEAAGIRMSETAFVAHSVHLMRLMPDWWHVPGGDEEERAAWCSRRLRSLLAATRDDDSLARLKGWLDATARRLRRGVRQASADLARFHADGIPYVPEKILPARA